MAVGSGLRTLLATGTDPVRQGRRGPTTLETRNSELVLLVEPGHGVANQLRLAVQSEFVLDVLVVGRDCFRADEELCSDLAGLAASSDELEDLQLALGQAGNLR